MDMRVQLKLLSIAHSTAESNKIYKGKQKTREGKDGMFVVVEGLSICVLSMFVWEAKTPDSAATVVVTLIELCCTVQLKWENASVCVCDR